MAIATRSSRTIKVHVHRVHLSESHCAQHDTYVGTTFGRSSVQPKTASERSGKPVYAPPMSLTINVPNGALETMPALVADQSF